MRGCRISAVLTVALGLSAAVPVRRGHRPPSEHAAAAGAGAGPSPVRPPLSAADRLRLLAARGAALLSVPGRDL